jgi:DNA-binding phage protein
MGGGAVSTCPDAHAHELVAKLLKMYLQGDDPDMIVAALGEEQTRRLKQLSEAAREAETYDRLVNKYGRQR